MSKTINQQAALLLKNLELQTVLHEHDEDIDAGWMSEPLQDAIKAVAAYKRRQDEVAYMFPLSGIVYDFMGGHLYEDAFDDYKMVSVRLLAAMADPEFNKHITAKIGEYSHRDLVNLLTRLVTFVANLQTSTIEPLLIIQDLKNYKYSEERLNEIKEEYEERLRVSLSGKYKRA